jgi:uncharacterized protein involved in exopolysaccharide biosynthesis
MSSQTNSVDDKPLIDIDILALVQTLWSNKLIIIGCILVFSGFGVFYAKQLPDIYSADTLLAPAGENASGGGLSGRLGGLASLAGVSLNSGGGDKIVLGLEVLKSRKFILDFIKKYDTAATLVAATHWDKETNILYFNESLYDNSNKEWLVSESDALYPTELELVDAFRNRLSIAQNTETGLVTLGFNHYSPVVSKNIIDNLVVEINATIRERDVSKARKSIEYLKEQLNLNSLTELRAGLFELIQSQTETIMLANASPEYLFQTIDPPVISDIRAEPNRVLICVLAAMFGALLGTLIALIVGKRK